MGFVHLILDEKGRVGMSLWLLLLFCLLACTKIKCQVDLLPTVLSENNTYSGGVGENRRNEENHSIESFSSTSSSVFTSTERPILSSTLPTIIVQDTDLITSSFLEPASTEPKEPSSQSETVIPIPKNYALEQEEKESIIPPIFVVNLDRAVLRWSQVIQEIHKAGLTKNIYRLSAVDGKKLPYPELCQNTTLLARIFQPRGVLGCYLSHRKFWSLVVEKNLSSAIVLEDDVQLVDGFKEKLIDNLQALHQAEDQEFDVILLGAIGRVDPSGKDSLGPILFSTYYGGTRPLKRISEHYYQPIKPAGTHGYIVSLAGAKKLLQLCPKAVHHVDLDAWRHPQLKIRMFSPMLVFQTFEDTTLTDFQLTEQQQIIKDRLSNMESVQKFHAWAKDPVTHQPWSHAFAEPLLQLGPGGPVITLGRHMMILGIGAFLSGYLRSFGWKWVSSLILKGLLGFTVSVRLLIWLLMNWK